MVIRHIKSKIKLISPEAHPVLSGLMRSWGWGLAFAPAAWFLGLNLVYYHLLALICFVSLIHICSFQNHTLYISTLCFTLFIFSLTYISSIIIHAPSGEGSRMIAAFYNLSYWIMGLVLIIFLSNIYTDELAEKFLAALNRLAIVSGWIAMAAVICQLAGMQTLVFETPLYGIGRVFGDTVLVNNSLIISILQPDWFISLWRPRFNLFSPYPTATGGLFVLFLFAAFAYASQRRQFKSLSFIVLVLSLFTGLAMTLARSSCIAFIIGLGAVLILERRRSFLWILIAAFVLLACVPLLEKLFEIFLGLREGSTETRADLYHQSLGQLEGADWVFGLGLKPRETAFSYPLGSHSTYLSIIFRMGILGIFFFVLFQIQILWRWFQLKSIVIQKRSRFILWRFFGTVFIGMLIWMATEDIDAPQLLCFVYFSCIGFFEGFRRICL
ncbi:MAG: hypothetical protein A2Z83_01300 [Omnitrophica bacterium GWA2_52_8]|nr:MAG: hypothetical protein A2Z83_01300 [Omnitrophica bacterium GWA2_52_8]